MARRYKDLTGISSMRKEETRTVGAAGRGLTMKVSLFMHAAVRMRDVGCE